MSNRAPKNLERWRARQQRAALRGYASALLVYRSLSGAMRHTSVFTLHVAERYTWGRFVVEHLLTHDGRCLVSVASSTTVPDPQRWTVQVESFEPYRTGAVVAGAHFASGTPPDAQQPGLPGIIPADAGEGDDK